MDGADPHNIPGDGEASYNVAIAELRLAGVKAGRFLPRHDRPDEIKASPIVEDVRRIGPALLYRGDSTRITPLLVNLHACVTDPPYELGFMGKSWDSSGVAAAWETWGGVRIALRPGAHLVAFAGSRTYHRIAKAIDDAGFEVRDQLMWLYGSGFPKSLDVSKALDKSQSGIHRGRAGRAGQSFGQEYERTDKGRAVSIEAQQWEGWGTALKPAHEPVCFARKPLSERTVAENVLRWATGALNVDDCKVRWSSSEDKAAAAAAAAAAQRACHDQNANRTAYSDFNNGPASLQPYLEKMDGGRWPANVLTDGSLEVLEAFPPSARDAIRYFYASKAGKEDREFGMDGSPSPGGTVRSDGGAAHTKGVDRARNFHPTVKPVDLMRWLCRLITPPGGVVLDPFMGSGSTGIAAVREGFGFVGIEQDPDYFEIAAKRVAAAVRFVEREPDLVREITKALDKPKQGTLL
jgi:site-specific DNA-methyltransferase (adenine-specific)